MSSGLKTGLAVLLLIAVIFGVTVISQLSPTTQRTTPGTQPGQAEADLPPLAFSVSEIKYDPKAEGDDYQNRLFPGFLEVGTGGSDTGSRNWIGFVLRNLRPEAIELSPLTPSCSKCTSARAATLPHAAMTEYASLNAVGSYFSVSGVPNPLAGLAWAETTQKLNWFNFIFTQPERKFTIPAAASRTEPTWVLLELDFKVYAEGAPAKVSAYFDAFNAKNQRLIGKPYEFGVTYAGREAFEVWPKNIAAGEFPEGIEPRTFDVYAFSMTRNLDRPLDAIVTNADPSISIGTPQRLSDREREQLVSRLSADLQAPVRVQSGYRYPVTVRRQAERQVPEVGDFERSVQFSQLKLSQRSYQVNITGLITGAVRLEGASKIDLGSYKAEFKTVKDVKLISEKLDTELELVPDRCEPKFVKYSLGTPAVEFGVKRWPLTLSIAEQEGRSSPWKGVVVLRTKGLTPVTYRFPVSGYGR